MNAPAFVAPQLATLADAPADNDGWVYERKLDGIRLIVIRHGDTVRLVTRNRRDRTTSYPELVDPLRNQPGAASFVADGEVVAFDGDQTSFARLQQRSGVDDPTRARSRGVEVYLYLFDLMHLDGDDLCPLPLRERKARLRDAIDFDDPLRWCSHRNGDGARYLDDACSKGWEGLIAKRADAPYRPGRSRDWLKLKCVTRQELVIGGYTDPAGTRHGFGALLVGYHDGDELRYAGRVGTGFDDRTLASLAEALAERAIDAAPFAEVPRSERRAHWVRPDLVAEIAFTEWTRAGRLRHPRFVGLRDDTDPAAVVREHPRPAP